MDQRTMGKQIYKVWFTQFHPKAIMKIVSKLFKHSVTVAAALAFCATTIPAVQVQAKTANQVKNENKAKEYKATQANKKAAKAAKKK